MLLTCCSPRSSKAMSRRSRTSSCAAALRQTPPGSASASSLAAMLTPSPKISPSSIMMSPSLLPLRNSMRRPCRCRGVAGDHLLLHLDPTAHRVDNAGELGEQSVAGVFDHSATVLGDLRVDQFGEMSLQALVRALLIRAHQARITGNIDRQDGRQSSLDPPLAHPAGPSRNEAPDASR